MLRRTVGMQKQYRHRFESFFLDDARHLARLLFVKRRAHRAVGKHALGHLKNIFPRHQRPVLAEARVERLGRLMRPIS